MDVAIIGGGPGGLMTAWHINNKMRNLSSVTIFEASQRLGGKLVSERFEKTNALYERGVAEFYDYSRTGPDPLRELIENTLGLSIVPMDSTTVVINDTIVRNEAEIGEKLGPKTLKAIEDFRKTCTALLTPLQYYESLSKDDNNHPWGRRTAYEVLESEISDDTARKFIRIAAHSDIAAASHLTNGLTALKNYVMDVDGYLELYSIVGGNERLTQELAKRINAKIELNSPIQKVGATKDGRYRLTINKDGRIETREFDAVVMALPLSWLSTIEWEGGQLESAMFGHIAHFDRPGHYVRVSILFEKPFWREKITDAWWMSDAFSGCCVYDEGARHDVAPYGVLGWLMAGNDALALANLDDETLIKRALDSLPSEFQHGRKLVLDGMVQRWLYTVNAVPGGFPVRDTRTNHLPEPDEHPGLFVVGDYLFDATLNGVLDSSDAATDLLMSHLIKQYASKSRVVRGEGKASFTAASNVDRAFFKNYRGRGPYNEAWREFFDADYLTDLIATIWGKSKGYRILDAGSASGLTIKALRDKGLDAWGIENNRFIHAQTPAEVEKYNMLGNVAKLPFPDNHFDFVYENCLYHLPESRLDRAISELHRVTRHGIIFNSVTSEIALQMLNKYDLTKGAKSLMTLWEWSEMFFDWDLELALEDQELLNKAWEKTLAAGFGPEKWFEDAESLRYSFYTKAED